MSSKFDQIRPWSVGVRCSWMSEKIFYLHVLENYPKYFYDILARRWAIVALWATCFAIDTDFWPKILLITDFLDVKFND